MGGRSEAAEAETEEEAMNGDRKWFARGREVYRRENSRVDTFIIACRSLKAARQVVKTLTELEETL